MSKLPQSINWKIESIGSKNHTVSLDLVVQEGAIQFQLRSTLSETVSVQLMKRTALKQAAQHIQDMLGLVGDPAPPAGGTPS